MAQCIALSSTLKSLPLVGQGLQAAALSLGGVVEFMVSGLLNLNPVAMAAFAVALILLWGVYQVTRIGASFIALAGFFVFVLCAV